MAISQDNHNEYCGRVRARTIHQATPRDHNAGDFDAGLERHYSLQAYSG